MFADWVRDNGDVLIALSFILAVLSLAVT